MSELDKKDLGIVIDRYFWERNQCDRDILIAVSKIPAIGKQPVMTRLMYLEKIALCRVRVRKSKKYYGFMTNSNVNK
jgi:hypothetical protein